MDRGEEISGCLVVITCGNRPVLLQFAEEVLHPSGGAPCTSGIGGGPLVDELLKPDITLELYKGFPGSFRPWDRQLRQSILLGTTDMVIALAPVEGALHQRNTLDTLGSDEPEFHCP